VVLCSDWLRSDRERKPKSESKIQELPIILTMAGEPKIKRHRNVLLKDLSEDEMRHFEDSH
jgi:hypothetical protein